MKRKENFIPFFILLLVIGLLVYFFSESVVVRSISSAVWGVTKPVASLFHHSSSESSEIARVKKENEELIKKLVEQTILLKENKALKDQFETTYPKSHTLIPARIVGVSSFIPGVSKPESIVIDVGKKDGVIVGQGVVVGNSLIGKVEKVSDSGSRVILLSHSSSSIRVKTLPASTQENTTAPALGILKGGGEGEMTVDNVLLSEHIASGDTIVSFGDLQDNGFGIPANLVVGKVISVDKRPSAVFQKAKVRSLFDVIGQSMVFVVKRIE